MSYNVQEIKLGLFPQKAAVSYQSDFNDLKKITCSIYRNNCHPTPTPPPLRKLKSINPCKICG